MKKILIYSFIFILFGCTSNEPVLTECQKENIGYFGFVNESSNAYDIFIDNKYYTQQPGKSHSSKWIKFPAGKQYTIKVQQVSGYIFNPTIKTYKVTLNQCDEKEIYFP
jgi:hypothetical protein